MENDKEVLGQEQSLVPASIDDAIDSTQPERTLFDPDFTPQTSDTISIELIMSKIEEYMTPKQVSRLQSNRASILGGCQRKIFYLRTVPEEAMPFSSYLNHIFRDGNMHETDIVRLLEECGFGVSRQQYAIDHHPEMREANITGHIDFIISLPGFKPFLGDAKSLNPYDCPKIDTVDDFNSIWYTKKWIDQIQLYMYGLQFERSFFILKDKGTSQKKVIECSLDIGRVKGLIAKAHHINECVAKNEAPTRIEYGDECERCPFLQHCLPDMKFSGPEMINDFDIIGLLEKRAEAENRYNQVAHLIKEFDALDEKTKAVLKKYKGNNLYVPGVNYGFEIKITRYHQDSYTVKASDRCRISIGTIPIPSEENGGEE